MGVVYRARQVSLNRLVAVKMILAGPLASHLFVSRFQAEAQTIARLRHPNIVSVHDLGEEDEQHYFVMDYIDGEDLAQRLRNSPVRPEDAVEWMAQVAEAVQYAHEKGVLHRDLKPSNILVDAAGQAHLTDFGLAKETAGAKELTISGTLLGTPSYMPPEQAAGGSQKIGPASDVYSLGAVFYELLTGRPPFRGQTVLQTLKQVMDSEPLAPRLLNPEIGRDLETICLKCLQKSAARRYGSAGALAQDLRRTQRGEPIAARPLSTAGKLWRWTRRHPIPVSLAAAGILVLAVSGVEFGLAARRISLAQRDTDAQRRRAEANAVAAGDHLADSYVVHGTQLLEENDVTGALPWLVAALSLQEAEPERAAIHRLRLASVLQRCSQLVQVLVHASYVNHAEFSPDGRYAVSAANDKRARIWDLRTGQAVSHPLEHQGDVGFGLFSPDGHRVGTVSEDGSARLWNALTGEPIGAPMRHTKRVNHGAFSLDGEFFVTASADGTAQVWDGRTGQALSKPLPHSNEVARAFFSREGRRVVTSSGPAARVWDWAKGKELVPPLFHEAQVNWALFSPDGTSIATASADRTARIWRADTGQPICPTLKHSAAVYQVAFDPTGARLVTAGASQHARLWDAHTGETLGVPMVHRDTVIRAIFSPDGQQVLTTSQDQSIRLWDADSGRPASPPMRHNGWVRQAAFSSDGRFLISASGDRTAKIWRPPPRESASLTVQQEGVINQVAFSPDGKSFLTAGGVRGRSGEVSVWDVASGERRVGPFIHDRAIVQAAFGPADDLLSADEVGGIRCWDTRSGRICWQRQDCTQAVQIIRLSPQGTRVVVASGPDVQPGWVEILDPATGQAISPPLLLTNCVFSAEFSPDGKQLLLAVSNPMSSTGSGYAEVRDFDSGTVVLGPIQQARQVIQAVWSPDGRHFLTVGAEQTARLWDAQTGRLRGQPMNHAGLLLGAAFSADGQKVVTFGHDQSARIWDGRTGVPVTPAMVHRGVVRSAVFSPDGRLLATVADDEACRVWDASTGQLITPLLTGNGSLRRIVFSPDSHKLLAGRSSGQAQVFVFEPESRPRKELERLAELLSGRRLDPSGGLILLEAETLRELQTASR
jgi:WD40 repeat protein